MWHCFQRGKHCEHDLVVSAKKSALISGNSSEIGRGQKDDSGQWYRSYGNENWEFDELGYSEHQRPADQGKRTEVSLGHVEVAPVRTRRRTILY